MSNAIATFPML